MRIIAISDIHGNLPALKAVFAAINSPPDMIIVAGDLVGFGPQPAEVIDLLRSQHCMFVKGNVDDYVCNPSSIERLYSFFERELKAGRAVRPLLPPTVIARGVEWTRNQLDNRLEFLSKLPFSISIEPVQGKRLTVVHANPQDLERPILYGDPEPELITMLRDISCDILVFGHSHNPFYRSVGDTILLDVASLGFPSDGSTEAPYAEITFGEDGWQVEQHRAAYDIGATASLIESSTMPDKDKILTLLRTARRVKEVLR